MDISVFNTQKRFTIEEASVAPIVSTLLSSEGVTADNVAVHFVGKKKICSLHAQYFDDPSPTDCITFPLDDRDDLSAGYKVLGEVFICPQVAFEYVSTHDGHAENLYEEMTLYLVHGLLHLIGYDDIDIQDQKIMRQQEHVHMSRLKEQNTLLRPKSSLPTDFILQQK